MNAPHATVRRIEVIAPLSGILFPLEVVPDPVFAQKMVGDGVSLDPLSGEVLAPVDGQVTQFHQAHHAVTITTPEGVEVLVHVGVDTVLLKGDGFEPLVAVGHTVRRGDVLLRFDVDKLALKAPSCLTQIVITNGEKIVRMQAAEGEVRAGQDVILSLDLADDVVVPAEQAGSAPQTSAEAVYSDWIALPNPVGLHARPAAVLAAEARKFNAEVRLIRGENEVNVRSIVSVLGLETRQGEQVRLKATGPQADEAVLALAKLLAEGCGELTGEGAKEAVLAPATPAVAIAPPPAIELQAGELAGVSASPGIAVGQVFQFRQQSFDVSETGEAPHAELARFEEALRHAAGELQSLVTKQGDNARKAILQAHLELLDDPDLLDPAKAEIATGKSAAFAWLHAFSTQAAHLAGLQNELLRERAADVRDVGRRVLAKLAPVSHQAPDMPEACILIAEELSPSDTASLDRNKVLGFCTTTGGATSHVAILARSLGIPAACGIDEAALRLVDGTQVIIDGQRGVLQTTPSDSDIATARQRITQQHARDEADKAAAHRPAITLDGQRIEVVANIRNADDARESLTLGGEGVGLLRSEFLFDDRDTAPTEAEQAAAYKAVAEVLGTERTLVIRTLDVGGDKPLPYLPLPAEDNPFLGLRGLRVSLARPDLFRTQLRAILQAAPLSRVHIMFPMVASLEELRQAKAILAEEMAAMSVTAEMVKVGMMVEVPSAAALADLFAPEVDFFSIGTNDLTQYTLAMDRGHPQLAKSADALHPAVLRLIGLTTQGARKHGKWVGVCGGIAGDPLAVPVLIGLGVAELSASIPAIPSVKACVQKLSLAECKELAHQVLSLGTAAEVRARLNAYAQKFENA